MRKLTWGATPRVPGAADALTVSPYLGGDSLEPFVDAATERGAGIFVLVKTSNPGGGLFQDRMCEGKPLYEHVAAFTQELARRTAGQCGYGIVGAVVGATYPQQLATLRAQMPHTWFLVPGFGAQGAQARDVRDAFAPDGLGAIVNSSRGIIFAHSLPPYRDRFGRLPLAGGRRTGYLRHDPAAECRDAGRPLDGRERCLNVDVDPRPVAKSRKRTSRVTSKSGTDL